MSGFYVSVKEQDGSTKREMVLRQSDAIKTILSTLESAGILTRANFNLVTQKRMSYEGDAIAEHTKKLFDLGYLNKNTFKFLWGSDADREAYQISLANRQLNEIIETLKAQQLLTENVLLQILAHPVFAIPPSNEGFMNFRRLPATIDTLTKANLLNENNLTKVLEYKNPENVGLAYRTAVNQMVGFLDRSLGIAHAPGLQNAPDYGPYTPENDLFWQLNSGLSQILPVVDAFLRAGLLNANTLAMIFDHRAPAILKSLIDYDSEAVPIKDYLLRSLSMDIAFLEQVIKALEKLKRQDILNAQTMELAFSGYFNNSDWSNNDKISAVKLLIEKNLFTPLNLQFVDKGTFVYYGNEDKSIGYDFAYRARILDDIDTYLNRFGVDALPPKTTVSAELAPVPSMLNELFKLSTNYFYKLDSKREYIPLFRELLLLQEKLFTAYTAFEKDRNKPALVQAFQQHINSSRKLIEESYTFTETLAALFNSLLNVVQSLLTSSTERPWGRFFSQGQRALLLADLKYATLSADANIREEAILVPQG